MFAASRFEVRKRVSFEERPDSFVKNITKLRLDFPQKGFRRRDRGEGFWPVSRRHFARDVIVM